MTTVILTIIYAAAVYFCLALAGTITVSNAAAAGSMGVAFQMGMVVQRYLSNAK